MNAAEAKRAKEYFDLQVKELGYKVFRDWHESGVIPETQEIDYEGADGVTRRFSPGSCRQAFMKYEMHYNDTIAREIKELRGIDRIYWHTDEDIALILMEMHSVVRFAKTKDDRINAELDKIIEKDKEIPGWMKNSLAGR